VHRRGVAHGHVVPANVLLPRRDRPAARLADYGTAAIAGRGVTIEGDVRALLEVVIELLAELPALGEHAGSASEIHERLEAEARRA